MAACTVTGAPVCPAALSKSKGLTKVFVHALLDGRDTPPRSAPVICINWNSKFSHCCGKIAVISGRYYSMDRDKRWDRTKLGYAAHVYGEGKTAKTSAEAIAASYAADVSDEFVKPVVLVDDHGQPSPHQRQRRHYLLQLPRRPRPPVDQGPVEPDFDGFTFDKARPKSLKMTTFMQYYDGQNAD